MLSTVKESAKQLVTLLEKVSTGKNETYDIV